MWSRSDAALAAPIHVGQPEYPNGVNGQVTKARRMLPSLTGNTGRLNFVATSFTPTINNDPGQFTSAGSFSAVPESGTTALFFGVAVLGFIAWRRRR